MAENINKQSLIEVIEDSIKKNWKLPAYSDYATDTSYTYGDVAKNIARLHTIYKACGIEQGDKICLCAKNSSRWAIAALSVITYGAVLVPVLSDFSREQIQAIYRHSDSVLMLCDAHLEDTFPQAIDLTNLSFFDGRKTPPLADFEKLKPKKVGYIRESPDTLAVISYTSGSTGHSKGVMLPYRALWSNAKFVDYIFDLRRGIDLMPLLPMSHMLGFAFEYLYGTCIGAHIHFLTKVPSPKIVLQAFQEVRPAMIVCVPLVIEKILQRKVFPLLRTRSFRLWLRVPLVRNIIYWQIKRRLYKAFGGKIVQAVIGGAALGKEADDFLSRIHFPYSQGYGMTECAPLISFDNYKHARKGSCGRAVPRMNIRIDSPDPQNQPGEILTQGMNTMLGYYKNPTETTETLYTDGWLHTGDLGTIDADGYLYIRGRKKTMLLGSNGQNIYPEEIEDKVLTLTHFEECVVVQREDKLVALVYISPKTMQEKGITRDHLDRHLVRYRQRINDRLPKFAALSAIEIQDEEFEKTPKRSIRRYLYK
jgi:long-chain acyl-CoA synthetase